MTTINLTTDTTNIAQEPDVFNYYEKYERAAVAIEKPLNYLGYFSIPFVSGPIRLYFATGQLIHAFALTIFASMKHLFSKPSDHYAYALEKHTSYMIHASRNIARALIEGAGPFTFNPILLGVSLFLYDRIGRNRYDIELNTTVNPSK